MKTRDRKHLYEIVKKYDKDGLYDIEEMLQMLREAQRSGATHLEMTDGEDYDGCGEYVSNGTTEFDFYTVKELDPEQIRVRKLIKEIEQKTRSLEHAKKFYKSQREHTEKRIKEAQKLLEKTLDEHVPQPDFDATEKEIEELKSQLKKK